MFRWRFRFLIAGPRAPPTQPPTEGTLGVVGQGARAVQEKLNDLARPNATIGENALAL